MRHSSESDLQSDNPQDIPQNLTSKARILETVDRIWPPEPPWPEFPRHSTNCSSDLSFAVITFLAPLHSAPVRLPRRLQTQLRSAHGSFLAAPTPRLREYPLQLLFRSPIVQCHWSSAAAAGAHKFTSGDFSLRRMGERSDECARTYVSYTYYLRYEYLNLIIILVLCNIV